MNILEVDLKEDYSHVVGEAISVLKTGGVIVYPTDTVYAIGCNALDEFAVKRIFSIKEQSSKPLPVLAQNLKWAEELVYFNDKRRELANKFWPGQCMLIMPKKDIIPPIVTTGLSTVALRVMDYPFTNLLLKQYGYPLVITSASMPNQGSTGDINKLIEAFHNHIPRPDLIIDAGVLPQSNPSVIIDCSTDKPKVLRIGPSKPQDMLKLLEL
ncbi:threonylcarbamoyl-AMP synthase [Candidatus Parcubacteria bacterium]|nr:threonylcarbamoyl-AMP synthase [Candidatus Parcubacteria bacterium]